jgi:hypothetical protein
VTEKEIMLDPILQEHETLGITAVELPDNTILYQTTLQRPYTLASDTSQTMLKLKVFSESVKRIFVQYKVCMKLTDDLPIFFRVSVNGNDITSTRSRGSGGNFYMTMVGLGVQEIQPGQNIVYIV